MPHRNKTRKPASTWNLAGRAFLICFVFLIVPLGIHTFLQYRREFFLEEEEVKIEEASVRNTLKAIGSQMSLRISDLIHRDWQLFALKGCKSAIASDKITVATDSPDSFAYIDQSLLIVGKKSSTTEASTISHPLKDLLDVKNAPFPIDVGFAAIKDQYNEQFPIQDTKLVLYLGATGKEIVTQPEFLYRIGTFAVLIILVGGGLVLILLRKMARPLNVLRSTMDRVSEGAVHSRYVKQSFGFEINVIGQYFNETLDSVLLHQQEAENERIRREKLAQEFRVAQEIQDSLLPKTFPTLPHLDIGAACLPAFEVGGDFYDVLPLSNGKVMIVVADVAGKGISACLFSLGLRSSLRALAEVNEYDVNKLLTKANDLFMLDAQETGQFVTLWIGILEGRTLHYASLGHPPALLRRMDHLEELSTHHPAMGLKQFDAIHTETVLLESADQLLLYSDGVTEAQSVHGKFYGIDRLKHSFQNIHNMSAAYAADKILKDVQHFSQGAPQHDDLTLLLIRIL